jgi:glycosyltransferase involved in cell wall biosynthesis
MPDSTSNPLISVITPVYNGLDLLDRAVESVVKQTFTDWELLAVDDCSADGSFERLQWWERQDCRIRALRTPENGWLCVARNYGLKHARGEVICYLDHDDEFYPDYLASIAQWCAKGDVLVFRYDLVYENAPSEVVVRTWMPDRHFELLFAAHIATCLGIAHRRAVLDRVGGFNEALWGDEDVELLRRFARAGIDFVFVPLRSGRYHVRPSSLSRSPVRLTRRQRETAEANWQAGRPLFGERPPLVSSPLVRKIAFASPYCLIDSHSGAAIATTQALQLLHTLGFQCRAFCGARMDAPHESLPEEVVGGQSPTSEICQAESNEDEMRLISATHGAVPVTIFRSVSTRGLWQDKAEIAAFLRAFVRFLDESEPDALVTYGGDEVALRLIELTRKRGIPVIFALHNFSYTHSEVFRGVDYVVVPSEFARRYYWDTLGLACMKLPNVIDWQRVAVADRKPQFVTFVNPEPVKGVYVFARIAAELARRRPDIRLLVVESRGQADWLTGVLADLLSLPNIRWLKNTPDPREFYRLTKLILMPSLWNENWPLVPAEAMLNGIPVLGSSRGGIPEVVGAGGFLFDIPACYTPTSRTVPPAEEVEPWVETILQLWDDGPFYKCWSRAARQAAERWRPDKIAPIYRDFFSNIFPQPGPPIMPRGHVPQ